MHLETLEYFKQIAEVSVVLSKPVVGSACRSVMALCHLRCCWKPVLDCQCHNGIAGSGDVALRSIEQIWSDGLQFAPDDWQ